MDEVTLTLEGLSLNPSRSEVEKKIHDLSAIFQRKLKIPERSCARMAEVAVRGRLEKLQLSGGREEERQPQHQHFSPNGTQNQAGDEFVRTTTGSSPRPPSPNLSGFRNLSIEGKSINGSSSPVPRATRVPRSPKPSGSNFNINNKGRNGRSRSPMDRLLGRNKSPPVTTAAATTTTSTPRRRHRSKSPADIAESTTPSSPRRRPRSKSPSTFRRVFQNATSRNTHINYTLYKEMKDEDEAEFYDAQGSFDKPAPSTDIPQERPTAVPVTTTSQFSINVGPTMASPSDASVSTSMNAEPIFPDNNIELGVGTQTSVQPEGTQFNMASTNTQFIPATLDNAENEQHQARKFQFASMEDAVFNIGSSPSKNKPSHKKKASPGRSKSQLRKSGLLPSPASSAFPTPTVSEMISPDMLSPSISSTAGCQKSPTITAAAGMFSPTNHDISQDSENKNTEYINQRKKITVRRVGVKSKKNDGQQTQGSQLFSPVPPFPSPGVFGVPTLNELSRRQTAPAGMESAPAGMESNAAAAAAQAFTQNVQAATGTPAEFKTDPVKQAGASAPDTGATCIKKKTRNTATPYDVNDAEDGSFHVNSSQPWQAVKPKGRIRRAKGFQRGIGKQSGIQHTLTDETSTTAEETADDSPSAMSWNSLKSPPPVFQPATSHSQSTASVPVFVQPAQQMPPQQTQPGQSVQFQLGVGGKDASVIGIKGRGKRRQNAGRRFQQQQHSHSLRNISVPSSSYSNQTQPSGVNVIQGRPTYGRSMSEMAPDMSWQPQQQQQQLDLEAKRAKVTELKEKGSVLFQEKDYRGAICVYTGAIQDFQQYLSCDARKDLLALLLSNRSASLMNAGAVCAAIDDCNQALKLASENLSSLTSSDDSPFLRLKLYTRLGRAFKKLGNVDSADKAFTNAIDLASRIQALVWKGVDPSVASEMLEKAQSSNMEATLATTELLQLRELQTKINQFEETFIKAPQRLFDEEILESLTVVERALSMADEDNRLFCLKLKMLVHLKRWRAVINHCERYAVRKVALDGCFPYDLISKNPYPWIPPARCLKANFFDDTTANQHRGLKAQLRSEPAAEAVIRLPVDLMLHYVKALRMEEEYAVAEACIARLEQLNMESSSRFGLSLLRMEKEKLNRTKTERNVADDLYARRHFEKASSKYYDIMLIEGLSAGGRLTAVLHCNRAACYIGLSKNKEAVSECTAALRIHPTYMRALLRRARSHKNLDQYRESIRDYRQWLDMARKAKTDPDSFLVRSPVIFDGPFDVTSDLKQTVEAELNATLQEKARAEERERQRNAYRQQQRSYSERFNSNSSANRRREYFFSGQSSSRRWDSFTDRGPNNSRSRGRNDNSNSNQRANQNSGSNGNNINSQRTGSTSPYSVLGVSRIATLVEVKKAYRKLCLKHHPDKGGDKTDFHRIQEAYDTLEQRLMRTGS